MEVKEAIEFLEDIYDWNTTPNIEDKVEENIPKIISLLEQGEKCRSDFTILVGRWDELFEENKINKKYREMWEELKKQYGHHLLKIMPNGIINEDYTINYFVEDLEQKYFPKENIGEVVKGITEQIKGGAEVAKEDAKSDDHKTNI